MIRDKKKKIAIIYEGEKTEENLFKNISIHFFADRADIMIMALPAAGNLYMLWTRLQADDFETDVIGVLREMNHFGRRFKIHSEKILQRVFSVLKPPAYI